MEKRNQATKSSLLLLFLFLLPFANLALGQTRISHGSERGSKERFGQYSGNTPSQGNQPYGHSSDSAFVDTSATKGLEYHEEIPDSVLRSKVFFFHYQPHSTKLFEVWNPSLDPTGRQYGGDPLDDMNGNYYLGKGSLGHAHYGLFPTLAGGLDYRLQDEEFEAYLKTPANVRFYQVLTPYSVLEYNNTLKKDYLIHLAHTQNIIPGWNVAFDYRLINPEGVLSGSGAKNHYLDVTTNYFSVDSRLQAQAGFIWQSFSMGENGGLTDDSYLTDNLMGNFAGLPVKLYGSGSEHSRHNAFARVTYNLVRQVERYRERDSLTVRYDTLRADSVVLVTDTLTVVDTLRVGTPHILNAGVFGIEGSYSHWYREARLTSFADSARWSEACATLFWTNDAYLDHRWHNPLKVTLGITPRRLEAIVRTDTANVHDTLVASAVLNPFAKVELQLWRATLTAHAELDNTLKALSPLVKESDLHGHATLFIPLSSDSLSRQEIRNSGLELTAAFQRAVPSVRMIQALGTALVPIKSERYGLHLFHNTPEGLLRQVDLSLSASHMDHNVWYDTLLTAHVGSSDLWLGQAALTLRLAWGWLHLDMQHLLQHSTDSEQLPVPRWTSKNSLYVDLTLFGKALRMQVGADVRYFSRFTPNGYDPGTGIFYHQDVETGNNFWGDLFINLQVKRATIFLKAGHLNALWESHPSYFLLPHYPSHQFALHWGMTWHFFD